MNIKDKLLKMQTFSGWGYGLGGAFCFLGLLSLTLGIKPLVIAAREKLKIVDLPGETVLQFKMPGSYIGVYMNEDQDPTVQKRIQELDYLLLDDSTQEVLEVTKVPTASYMSEKQEKQIPLFKFVIDREGRYILRSGYPYDMEGPEIEAVLFNMDLRYVRAELIIGVIVFIVFEVLGIYFIRKNYKQRHLKKIII